MGQVDDRANYRARQLAFTSLKIPDSALICQDQLRRSKGAGCAKSVPNCPSDISNTTLPPEGTCKIQWERIGLYLDVLQASKFGLFLRGDTACSSRLYDFIGAGSLPIIVSEPARPTYLKTCKHCKHRGFQGNLHLKELGVHWTPTNLFQQDAMPFPTDLPWDDFAFFVPWEEFRDNPTKAIENIVNAPKEVLDKKLATLHAARSSLIWEGDDSRVASLVLRAVGRAAGKEVADVSNGKEGAAQGFQALPTVRVDLDTHNW